MSGLLALGFIMSRLFAHGTGGASVLVTASGERASIRSLGIFASHLCDPNTRWAYSRAVTHFRSWCEKRDGGADGEAAPRGKTPVLDPQEARQLLNAIDVTTPIGLCDRVDGLCFRADRRGPRYEGRGCLREEMPLVGATARKGRQAA